MRDKTPWEIGREREALLAEGLRNLAARCGIKLREPLHIDTNGEFPIVCVGDEPPFCGRYGKEFAEIINKHGNRTGIIAHRPGYQDAQNGWCYMNHFDVERMLSEQQLYTPPVETTEATT